MPKPVTLAFALCAILSPMTHAHGGPLTRTTTQRATIGGVVNCIRLVVDIARIDDGTNHRTWLAYEIYDCPAGSSDPTHLRTRISQQINDADFEIQPHLSKVHTTASDGTPVTIQWTVSDTLHTTYDAKWTNKTPGQMTTLIETTDTRSAVLTGSLLGIDLAPRSGQLITSTSENK